MLYDTSEETYQWSPDIPEGWWVVGDGPRDLLTALTLAGVDVSTTPASKWVKPLLTASRRTHGPWHMAMPTDAWEAWVEQTVDTIATRSQMVDLSYYEDVYSKSMEVLGSLKPAHIDENRLEDYVSDKSIPKGVRLRVNSFRPHEGKACDPIKYDMLETISGRMKVKEGPQILHLRKDHRDIFKSRYKGGSIVQLDYVSLEPRLALALANKDVPEDVYADLGIKVFNGEQERKTVKFFVLAALYGSGADKVSEQTGLDVKLCRQFIPKVKAYFGRNELMGDLVKECKDHQGTIRNHYGRVIRVRDPAPHKIYNHKIQSDAVDIAMLGFWHILKQIKGHKITPLFVIHDALILDCGEEFNSLINLIKLGKEISNLGIHLPLEFSTLKNGIKTKTN